MAEPLSTFANRIATQCGCAFCAFGAVLPHAYADNLPDPTRPPAVLSAPQVSSDVAAGPRLQSVLISPGRRVAIISGQTVHVGDKVGDAQLVSIAETEVVLRNGKDLQTLKLFPDLEKHPVAGVGPKPAVGSHTVKDK